jgi:hypothetical protein
LKWHRGNAKRQLYIFSLKERRQVSFSVVWRVSKPFSFHMPIVLGLLRWPMEEQAGHPPFAGVPGRAGRGRLAVGAGILLSSGGPSLMAGQAACAAQTTSGG